MQIAVIGLGYVGLVTAACLARLGQRVRGLDSDVSKVEALAEGRAPFYEPGLAGALTEGAERLSFTARPDEALAGADVILICVGTPSRPTGEADLTAVMAVADTIAEHVTTPAVIALRSTVPVGTTETIERRINAHLRERGWTRPIPIVSNPEFLRTGRALDDFLRPSRVVLGRTELATDGDIDVLATLYRPLEAPIFVVDARSAELVKNAANAYLATRISFVNELAGLCEATGASVGSVIDGIAADPRIGGDYLRPGLGYGGSCLPKDVRSMIAQGDEYGEPMALARAVDEVNRRQAERAADRIADAIDRPLASARIALLGLAFKPDTDDIRDSPAIALAHVLRARGATVVATDPQAGARASRQEPWLEQAESIIDAARGADAVVLATEWPAYVTADLSALAAAMRGCVLFDGRNALDPARVASAGLAYVAVGGSSSPSSASVRWPLEA
jgi:UDPglucose 6-dehydrogenase